MCFSNIFVLMNFHEDLALFTFIAILSFFLTNACIGIIIICVWEMLTFLHVFFLNSCKYMYYLWSFFIYCMFVNYQQCGNEWPGVTKESFHVKHSNLLEVCARTNPNLPSLVISKRLRDFKTHTETIPLASHLLPGYHLTVTSTVHIIEMWTILPYIDMF